jgi:UDP-glucose 4-epimerase
MKILVTGATGKVGRAFIQRLLDDPAWTHATVRALCHNRKIDSSPRLEVVRGSMDDREDVAKAVEGVTHVLHLATSKETPETIMDVAVKGLFWLLEACRLAPTFRQLVLIGGDAGIGHFFYPHPVPVTEDQEHTAYPGCYALSKVLEEVMLEQYFVQYGFAGCCLRAPWIMEKDDFKFTLSFGEDVFGGPRWADLVAPEQSADCAAKGTVPVMLDAEGIPVKRNFVHVDDLVEAIFCALRNPEKAHQELFNICMDEPVDYGEVGRYLSESRGLPTLRVRTDFHSTWLSNSKARFLLGWSPRYDLRELIDAAFEYERKPGDPRKVWYPG